MQIQNKVLVAFGLLLATASQAADVLPTVIKPLETDLARSELRLNTPYSYRLGLNYVEGHDYTLYPTKTDQELASNIRRELNFSLMLPHSVEVGAALYDTQQATGDQVRALYGSTDHKKQKIGGAVYARYYLIQSEKISSSVILQFEPGTADKTSFHQASQDKTAVAVHLDGSPFAYTQAGVYAGITKRHEEHFRHSALNDEALFGGRISIGPEMIKGFLDAEVRSLPYDSANGDSETKSSRQMQLGLEFSYHDLHIEASSLLAGKNEVGIPARGYQIALQMVTGKSSVVSPPKAEEVKIDPAAKPEAMAPALKPDDNLEDVIKTESTEGDKLEPIKVYDEEQPKASTDDLKPSKELDAPGSDEFQKWDAEQKSDTAHGPSDAEKAEKEYRADIERENKAKAAAEAQKLKDEEAAKRQALDDEKKLEKEDSGSSKDIEKELNQYTLPDNEDVNWNGLGNK